MKKIILSIAAVAAVAACSPKQETMEQLAQRVFDVAQQQCTYLDSQTPEGEVACHYDHLGKYKFSGITDWVSGFFPGTCWILYEQTGNEAMKALAEKHTLKLADLTAPGTVTHHDIGFMVNCSYGKAYEATGDEKYLPEIKDAAVILSGRYNPTVKCIMSWNPNSKWQYPVIIDNMMNLELLCNAADKFGLDSLRDIAVTHAETTMANHFRPDYSSYHVVSYIPETGEVEKKNTWQGLSDDSCWSRGEAWGLYGYTMMYRMTGKEEFLAQAEKIAGYILAHLPEDGIPFWDYDSPCIPDTFVDSSAGAIMASAFVELSTLTKDTAKKGEYLRTAEKEIRTLASDKYLAQPGKNGGFLIRHGVGALSLNSQIDVPLSYGDYYFLEAIARYLALK